MIETTSGSGSGAVEMLVRDDDFEAGVFRNFLDRGVGIKLAKPQMALRR